MSWTDLKSIEQINKIRDLYNIKTFVETGTYRGINAEVQSHNFEKVVTCELKEEYFDIAIKKIRKYNNIIPLLDNSIDFLKKVRRSTHLKDIVFIYLDAHFYDRDAKEKWVVLNELKALKNFRNCVIAIHDFDNNELGHLNYEGETLNFDLLKDALHKVNPEFHYYTNSQHTCKIVTDKLIEENYPYLEMDNTMVDTLDFIWSSNEKAYRGILYCTPTELDLGNFDLRKL